MSIFKRNSIGREEKGNLEQSAPQRERFNFNAALKGFREISMEELEIVCGGSKSNKKDTPPKNRN